MPKNNSGVTLIELLVVLSVLCISLGIVRVSAAGHSARVLHAACNELQADLRYAQRQAIIENRKYQVLFPMTKNGYSVLRHDSGLGFTTVVKNKEFSNGISLAGTNAAGSAITYTTRGTTGDACTITLKNNDYLAEMTVNLGSGRVTQKKFTRF